MRPNSRKSVETIESLGSSQKTQRPHFRRPCAFERSSGARQTRQLAFAASNPSAGRSDRTYASAAGQHKCHWSKRSQATPLLPNASTPTTLPRGSRPTPGPKRWLWTRDKTDKPLRRQIRGGRLPTTRREREHPSPAGGLRRRRERIGPSGRDELSAPHTSPLPS